MSALVPFADWPAVLAHVRSGDPLWYQAPLDMFPTRVDGFATVRGLRSRTVRISPPKWRGADSFSADAGHLARFWRVEGKVLRCPDGRECSTLRDGEYGAACVAHVALANLGHSPVGLLSLSEGQLLRRARCASEARVTFADGRAAGLCATGMRDWAAKRGLPEAANIEDPEVSVSAHEVAALAVESKDRLVDVLLILRAAGKRYRRAREERAEEVGG